MKFGYARVSTKDQNLVVQLDALATAGCDKIITEMVSGNGSKERPELDHLVENLREGDVLVIDMYKSRKQLAEHPFGTIKRAFGFSYFLTRGTESVKTESLMHFLAYNMKRAINIVGTKELIGMLQG